LSARVARADPGNPRCGGTEADRQRSVGCEERQRFQRLFGELYPQLLRYARWRCGRADGADDLVQDTLLRAWRGIGSLRDEESARAWVFTILRHELARSAPLRPQSPISLEEMSDSETPRVERDGTDAIAVRTALARMHAKYRAPLVLQVLSGMNCREIAAALGISETAVMSRLFRARRQLRALL